MLNRHARGLGVVRPCGWHICAVHWSYIRFNMFTFAISALFNFSNLNLYKKFLRNSIIKIDILVWPYSSNHFFFLIQVSLVNVCTVHTIAYIIHMIRSVTMANFSCTASVARMNLKRFNIGGHIFTAVFFRTSRCIGTQNCFLRIPIGRVVVPFS